MSQQFIQGIIRLQPHNARELSKLLSGSAEYNKFFHPFEFDEVTLADVLSKNLHWAVHTQDGFLCYFMLRGFAEKWESPSFGMYVREDCSGMGLGTLACQFVLIYAKAAQLPRLYLKVHPENPARKIYEKCGFREFSEKDGEIEYQWFLDG